MLKKNIRTLGSLILLVASAMPLLADWAVEHQLKVTVPFAFSADREAMPAGEYIVSVHPENGTILMQTKGHSPLILTTIPKESNNVFDRGRLVFQKYGTTMSLTEVWTRGNSVGQTLPYNPSTKEETRSKGPKQNLVVAVP